MDLNALPSDTLGLLSLVFVLGIRHGFDADHLAAIDGLTRLNLRPRTDGVGQISGRFSGQLAGHLAGVLFSIGHGLVVIPIALLASLAAREASLPPLLESTGVWVSVALLTALALLNLRSVWFTPRHETTPLVGWRSGALSRLFAARGAPAIIGVGALFAISFDTISQALLFAVLSKRFGGWPAATGMAGLFIAGMLLTDGLNGWWLARLLARADRVARLASRVMAATVGVIGLGTAAVVAGSQLSPSFDAWLEGVALQWSLTLVGLLGSSFLAAMWLARTRPAARESVALDEVERIST